MQQVNRTGKPANKKAMVRNIIIIGLIVALVAAGLIYAYVKKQNRTTWEKITDEKKIVIAMEGDWLPWTYHGDDGKLTGFDYEVGLAVAKKLGVEAQFEECPWDSILAGIGERYDVCINGVDWTKERAESYTLSKPYLYNYPVLIVREGSDIKSFEDLKGKKTANTASSTYAALAESYGATNQPVDDLNQTLQQLSDGRIDATINSADTFKAYKDQHPDCGLVIAATADSANSVVIVMPKDKGDTLAVEINKAIDELLADGTLRDLSIKYFGTDLTIAPAAPADADEESAPSGTAEEGDNQNTQPTGGDAQ